MIKELEYPAYAGAAGFQRISWGAVFAGTITSLAALAAMASLGAGLGLLSGPLSRGLSAGLGAGTVVWTAISTGVSFYAGGWISGRLTGIARVSESVIHGVVAWGAATIMVALFLAPAVNVLFFRAVAAFPGVPVDRLVLGTVEGELSILGRGAFLMAVIGLAAAASGARAGTRVLRPVPMPEVRRERAGV